MDGRGDWIRTSDPHTPSVMRYQAALRPDLFAAFVTARGHLVRRASQGKRGRQEWRGENAGKSALGGASLSRWRPFPRFICLRRWSARWSRSTAPGANRTQGVTIYLANNGVHADLILPARAEGLDWRPLLPPTISPPPIPKRTGSRSVPASAGSISTPRAGATSPRRLWAALTGGERVMHVEWVDHPAFAARAIRLRPRNIAACGNRSAPIRPRCRRPPNAHRPSRLRPRDAFYQGHGRASAVRTCNNWAGDRLRLAGVKTGLWTPFGRPRLALPPRRQST